MKINDNTKLKLSESSYQNYDIGRQISTPKGEFEVIEKRDDTQNGLRAYAYAPIVNGKSDTSNIVMGYAGTELTSIKDWKTNVNLPFHNNTTNLKIDNQYKKLKNTTINEKYNKTTDDNDMLNTMDSFGEMVTKKMTHSYEPNDIATKGHRAK